MGPHGAESINTSRHVAPSLARLALCACSHCDQYKSTTHSRFFFQRVSSAIRIRGRLFVSITEDLPNRRWLSAIGDQLGRSVVSAKGRYWPRVFELSIS